MSGYTELKSKGDIYLNLKKNLKPSINNKSNLIEKQNDIPIQVQEALLLTPLGIRSLFKYFRVLKFHTARNLVFELFEEELTDEMNQNKVNEKGYTYVNEDGDVVIRMTTYNKSEDRMINWKSQEILNIVAVHESYHIVLKNGSKEIYLDEGYGLYYYKHYFTIREEFKARIQYSLMYPKNSTIKLIWLENYIKYFEIQHRVYNPVGTLELSIWRNYSSITNVSDKTFLSEEIENFENNDKELSSLKEQVYKSEMLEGTRIVNEIFDEVLKQFEFDINFMTNLDIPYFKVDKNVVARVKELVALNGLQKISLDSIL